MKKFTLVMCYILMLLITFHLQASAREASSYNVYIKTFKRNSVIIEFPQIKGMSNAKKQKEINYLLEREIFQYITDCYNDNWLEDGEKVSNILETISNTYDSSLEFICHTGMKSDDLLSIRYAVYGYSHGGAHPNTWGYAYTIDLDKLEIVQLSDLVNLDDSLLDLDGSCIFDRDYLPNPYETDVNLYETLSDGGRYSSRQEILTELKSDKYNSFYITKEHGISFFFSNQNHESEIEIAFDDVKSHLTPHYLEKLTFAPK